MEIIAFHYEGSYSVLLHVSASFRKTIHHSLRQLIFLPN